MWAVVLNMAHTAKSDMNYGLSFEACHGYSLLTFTIRYRFRSALYPCQTNRFQLSREPLLTPILTTIPADTGRDHLGRSPLPLPWSVCVHPLWTLSYRGNVAVGKLKFLSNLMIKGSKMKSKAVNANISKLLQDYYKPTAVAAAAAVQCQNVACLT